MKDNKVTNKADVEIYQVSAKDLMLNNDEAQEAFSPAFPIFILKT